MRSRGVLQRPRSQRQTSWTPGGKSGGVAPSERAACAFCRRFGKSLPPPLRQPVLCPTPLALEPILYMKPIFAEMNLSQTVACEHLCAVLVFQAGRGFPEAVVVFTAVGDAGRKGIQVTCVDVRGVAIKQPPNFLRAPDLPVGPAASWISRSGTRPPRWDAYSSFPLLPSS